MLCGAAALIRCSSMIRRALDLVDELVGRPFHPRVQQESAWGIVLRSLDGRASARLKSWEAAHTRGWAGAVDIGGVRGGVGKRGGRRAEGRLGRILAGLATFSPPAGPMRSLTTISEPRCLLSTSLSMVGYTEHYLVDDAPGRGGDRHRWGVDGDGLGSCGGIENLLRSVSLVPHRPRFFVDGPACCCESRRREHWADSPVAVRRARRSAPPEPLSGSLPRLSSRWGCV